MKISIIIPTYNESSNILDTLNGLQGFREQGHEIVVVDGGSSDSTLELAEPLVDCALSGPKGRAAQMNTGAQASSGDLLLFVHADSSLPNHAASLITSALQQSQRVWGRFDVRLSGAHILLRVVESMMNIRSRVTGIATGDQAIFVRRDIFEQQGGYPDIPLMEDVALSKRLKRISLPVCIRQRLTTSSRRWEEHGIWRTIFLMWRLRFAYFVGEKPEQLVRLYR